MSLRSPLSTARGLGSAKDGVHHWWVQRVTAAALIPLVLWFVYSVATLAGADHESVRAWLVRPWNATLMVLFLATLFQHSQLGVQVVIEDYVGGEFAKIASLLASKFLHALFAVASILAVLRIVFGGA